ncbi:MAG: type II secretion system minor pseudopilin GspJ, partial [Proteobacteria bacterium]|nr:type II secretion system minor pseudopilin GspJ [Pseudomonadota bacterium]
PRASLQRVAWQRDGDILSRLHWRMLDPAQDSEPVRLEVLDGVERFAVRFLDDSGQWHEQWPSLEMQTGPGEQSADAPVAMEFVVELEDAGRIRRLVEMP